MKSNAVKRSKRRTESGALLTGMSIVDSKYEAEDNDQFAQQRSHEASKIAYDFGKASAQACLVINGGAATAVIALVAKSDSNIAWVVPACLAVYALGVAAGALMMFGSMRMADEWNYFWYHMSYTGDEDKGRASETKANWWASFVKTTFAGSVICFLVASVALAVVL
jgi:hypothetical protein